MEPMAVRREPGLLRTEVELPLEVLMPIWVGMTWTWTVPVWELEEPLELSLTVAAAEVELEGLSVIMCKVMFQYNCKENHTQPYNYLVPGSLYTSKLCLKPPTTFL